MDIKVEIKGLEKVARNLEARIRRFEQSTMRQAFQAAAAPIRDHAERLGRTLISPRLEYVDQIKTRGSSGTLKVGPSTQPFSEEYGKTVTHAMIGYWFEFGYEIRHTPKGPSLRHVGARPTMTPAWEAQKDNAVEAFVAVMRAVLEEDVPA